MYRVKSQLDNGDVVGVDVARVIIEGTGTNGDEEIHLIVTHEGIIVDVVANGSVVATSCMDPEVLSEQCV